MARVGRRRGQDDQRADTRAAINAATVAILAEQGFSGTSARAVAERAGVAPGGVFYHFGSMDQLLAEVYNGCLNRRIARLRAAADSSAAGVTAVFAQAVRDEFHHPDSRALLELVVGAITSPVLAEQIRTGFVRSYTFTRELIESLLADSPVAALLPMDLVAQLATSAFFGLTVMDLVGADVDLNAMIALVNRGLDLFGNDH